jgi:fatty acid desaturase
MPSPSTKPRYQKLVRGGSGNLAGRNSLWLADDHVLLVETSFMTERYQRAWLRDIQGFFIRPSRQAKITTIIGLGLSALFAGLTALGGGLIGLSVTMLVVSIVVVLAGIFAGRNCHFYAVTAVQRREWSNVTRRRAAHRLIAKLTPLIEAAQRDVSANP